MGLAADPLAWARAIHLLSSALVTGTLLFGSFVSEPAFRSASDLAPAPLGRFRTISARLVLLGLVLSLVSGAAWLGLLAQRIGDQPLTLALGETAWTLLTQTQFGTIWQLRLVCALVLAALLIANHQGSGRAAVLEAIALVVGVVFMGTLAWSGHGAATPGGAGYVHTSADILHLVAAAAWVGGLVPFVMMMRSGLAAQGDPLRMVTVDVLHRFSNLGILSVAVILVTGAVNIFVLAGSVDVLTQTNYGRLLVLKIMLFLAMLGLAAVNRLRLTPKLAAAGVTRAGETSCELQGIYRNAVVEIALGILVFVLVGSLGLMEPAAPMHAHMH